MSHSLLIADCGATSGKWTYADCSSGSAVRFHTGPVNPAIYDIDRITAELAKAREQSPGLPSAVILYAAGAIGKGKEMLSRSAAMTFGLPPDKIKVESDLIGAAFGLLGHRRGIACILGTGSNSCLWDGNDVERRMPPMGYILGDEGSGAALGAAILRKALRRQLSRHVMEKWEAAYPGLTYETVVERVYRSHAGSTYIASFVPFIAENIDEPEIRNLVCREFDRFLDAITDSYPEITGLSVGFSGGIASTFSDLLTSRLEDRGIHPACIIDDPLDKLVERHLAESVIG